MKPNIGPLDRLLRIGIGIIILVLGIYFKNWLGMIGIIPIATAIVSWCPLYLPFGLSSCKLDSSETH